jgi:hypothetical protein
VPYLHLEGVEAQFGQLARFLDYALGAHGAEAGVGGDALLGVAEQLAERQVVGPGEDVPGGHVDPGGGHAGEALGPQEPEHGPELALDLERGNRVALQRRPDALDEAPQGLEGKGGVGADVGAPGRPLARLQVDEHQGGGWHLAGAGLHGALQRDVHAPCPQAGDGKSSSRAQERAFGRL